MSDVKKEDSNLAAVAAASLPRRSVLKGTAGILAAGMFPAVHAQDKIVLRYLGTAVNQDKEIADKFKADTGIEIQYVAVTTDDVTKRAVTAPNSFDLIDTEYFSLKNIVPTGNLKGIDTKRIKNADKITTLFTSARARATRCCWPPESSPGLRCARCPMATRSSRSLAFACRSALATPFIFRLKATLSSALRCGNRAKLWNIIAVPRSAAGRSVMFRFSSSTSPLLTVSCPAIIRKVVLLPQPDGPSRQQ